MSHTWKHLRTAYQMLGTSLVLLCSSPLFLFPHLFHRRVLHHFTIRHLVHTLFGAGFLLLATCFATVHIHHYYSLKVIVDPSNALPASLDSLTAASISTCFVERGSIPCLTAL